MLGWWRKRWSDRERISRQADELMKLHGENAYAIARDHRILSLECHRQDEQRFWSAVARAIAERSGREVGLDAATRYLER